MFCLVWKNSGQRFSFNSPVFFTEVLRQNNEKPFFCKVSIASCFRDYSVSTFVKFSEKLTVLTLWYACVRVCIRRWKMLVFWNILWTYKMNDALSTMLHIKIILRPFTIWQNIIFGYIKKKKKKNGLAVI